MTSLVASPDESTTVVKRDPVTKTQARMWDIVARTAPGGMALIGYGGAAGGGKTRGIVELGLDLAQDFPGNKVLIGRKDYSDLRASTMQQFDLYVPSQLVVRKNDSEHWREIRQKDWPEGVVSRVIFRDLKDYLGIAGEEYGAALVDEAGEVPVKSALMLLSRLRWRLPEVIMKTPRTEETPWGRANVPCNSCAGAGKTEDITGMPLPCQRCKGIGVYPEMPIKYIFAAASNPWPGWFKEWFVDRQLPEEALRVFNADVNFIPALAKDNPFLPPDYEARLRAIYPPDWVKRLMDGLWDAFIGQVYPGFSPTIHEWRGQLPDPKDVTGVIGGLDFGGHNPHAHMSAGTCALVLKSNRLIVVGEFEARGVDVVHQQLAWMQEMEATWLGRYTGPRIRWKADKSQMLGIKLMRSFGLFKVMPTHGGPGSVEHGIGLVSRRFQKDANGLPGIYYLPKGFIKEHPEWGCEKLPARIMAYRYAEQTDENKPAAREPLKVGDDLPDAFRYMLENVDRIEAFGDPNVVLKNALPVILGSSGKVVWETSVNGW